MFDKKRCKLLLYRVFLSEMFSSIIDLTLLVFLFFKQRTRYDIIPKSKSGDTKISPLNGLLNYAFAFFQASAFALVNVSMLSPTWGEFSPPRV